MFARAGMGSTKTGIPPLLVDLEYTSHNLIRTNLAIAAKCKGIAHYLITKQHGK
jgi:hypothetical protein